jgi:hypothetical protein
MHWFLRPIGISTALLAVVGCGRSRGLEVARDDAPVAVETHVPRSECAIAGSMIVRNAADFFVGRDGANAFAIFSDRPVDLRTTEVPTIGGARLRVVANAKFGWSFEGWIEPTRLDFSAARDLELAKKTAYVPKGARLSIVAGAGRSVVVSPFVRDVTRFDVVVGCDAIAIGKVEREQETIESSPSSSTEPIYALTGESLPIAATPNGDPVFTLRGNASLRIPVAETHDGMHVRFEDGIVIDGWIRPQDVHVPLSHAVHTIGCGVGVAINMPMPSVAAMGIARKNTPIFVGASPGGMARGSIAAGGSVIVLNVASGFAEIVPRCGELVPRTKEHFFVEAASLVIGPETSIATLRTACA